MIVRLNIKRIHSHYIPYCITRINGNNAAHKTYQEGLMNIHLDKRIPGKARFLVVHNTSSATSYSRYTLGMRVHAQQCCPDKEGDNDTDLFVMRIYQSPKYNPKPYELWQVALDLGLQA